MASQLHLPSLTIEGFRGIHSLKLENLGRVTLLAGKNSIGKTTILEAIKVFASRGSLPTLSEILHNREEFDTGIEEDGDRTRLLNIASLFHNYVPGYENELPLIRIASRQSMSLELVEADVEPNLQNLFFQEYAPNTLRVVFDGHDRTLSLDSIKRLPRRFRNRFYRPGRTTNSPDAIAFESLGPGLLDNTRAAQLWHSVVFTSFENSVIEALRLVVGKDLERIAIVSDPYDRSRIVAKFKNFPGPVPLKRLGDGAQRLLGIAVALANCQDGILLVDEVENGIHFSIQPALWRMIFTAAKKGNIQVFAATHGWDCIVGFAIAANQSPEVGALIRLEQFKQQIDAIHYSEEELEVAAQQRIEVR